MINNFFLKYANCQLTFLFIICIYSFLTGCHPSINELWIREDGSGRFEQTYDMSSYIAFVKAQVLSDEEAENEERVIELLKDFMHGEESFDTSFTLASVAKRNGWIELDSVLLEKVIFLEKTVPKEFTVKYLIQFNFKDALEFKTIQKECLKLFSHMYVPDELKLDPSFYFQLNPDENILFFKKPDYEFPLFQLLVNKLDSTNSGGTVLVEGKMREEIENLRLIKVVHDWLESEVRTIIHLPEKIDTAKTEGPEKNKSDIICTNTVREMIDTVMLDTILVKW